MNPDAKLRQRAKKHLKRAIHWGHKTIVERYDAEEGYRKSCEEENLTREDMLQFDQLAEQQGQEVKMPLSERQSRMRNHTWDVVQSRGGGRQTIPTKLYPKYADAVEAKASASSQAPSSSSSYWNQQRWAYPSTTPPWQQDEWWQKKW